MKYIEKVILQNFQSHKNSVIEFDNQLNVIVGPSDSGKTAILRGIRWALYNEPSGDYFVREGESECSVTIVLNDGTKIKRYRSKSKNSYFIYDSDNNEIKFEGFGTSVPQEIIDKTGIKKILLDSEQSNAVNLSDQLEGAFLLSERTSTRASSIGRLVGVNIIDDALRETLKDSRNLSSTKKNIEDNIFSLEKELSEYEYLDELMSRIDYIEKLKNEIQDKNKLFSKYKELLQKFSIISQEKRELKYYLKKLESVNSLDNVINNISLNIYRYSYLNKQKKIITKLILNKDDNIKLINSLKNIDKVEHNILELVSHYNIITKLTINNYKLNEIKSEISDLKCISSKLNKLHILQDNINRIEKYIQVLNKLTILKDREFSLRKSLAIGIQYVEKLQKIGNVSILNMNLQEKINLLSKLKGIYSTYNSNKTEINKTGLLLQDYKDEINKQILSYRELLLKQETCPLCFSIIDSNKIDHIISHYN